MCDSEQDSSVPVDHEQSRSEHVEAILAETECLTDPDHKYPMRREELATEYEDYVPDLPNETESLGSVFGRLVDERPLEHIAEDTHAVESLKDEREE